MKNNSKETDRTKETSIFAIKFANTVFVFGILYSVLVSVVIVRQIYTYPESSKTIYFSFFLFAVLSAALFGLGLRKLRDELKVNMSVLLITVAISVYGFEIYLEFAKLRNLSFVKTRLEVLDGLNDSGIKSYPNFIPNSLAKSNGIKNTKGRIYPLEEFLASLQSSRTKMVIIR